MPCGPLPEMLAPVLEHYRETLDDTAVLVPVGGLACLDFLADLTSGPSCALVADKGHASAVELCSHAEPAVVPHGAGFSLMVNFDCLTRYVRDRGGLAVLPGEPARSLVVAAFVLGEVADRERFAAAVQDELVDTGPDNFFALRPLLSGDGAASVETMLAGLRLARFDPTLLIELLPRLLEVLPADADYGCGARSGGCWTGCGTTGSRSVSRWTWRCASGCASRRWNAFPGPSTSSRCRSRSTRTARRPRSRWRWPGAARATSGRRWSG